MDELIVSEIQIIPIKPRDGLVAFASCVINNQIYLGNIAIYTSLSSSSGFRITYPTKILNNGAKLSIVHPINKETGSIIQKRIVEDYLKLIEDLTKGGIKNGQEPDDT